MMVFCCCLSPSTSLIAIKWIYEKVQQRKNNATSIRTPSPPPHRNVSHHLQLLNFLDWCHPDKVGDGETARRRVAQEYRKALFSLRWFDPLIRIRCRAIYVIYCSFNRNILLFRACEWGVCLSVLTASDSTRYGGSYPMAITSTVVVALLMASNIHRYVYINAVSCCFLCPTSTVSFSGHYHLDFFRSSCSCSNQCSTASRPSCPSHASLIYLMGHICTPDNTAPTLWLNRGQQGMSNNFSLSPNGFMAYPTLGPDAIYSCFYTTTTTDAEYRHRQRQHPHRHHHHWHYRSELVVAQGPKIISNGTQS